MFLLILILILTLLYIFVYYYERRNLPPGPPSIPFFGSLPFLAEKGPKGFLDISFAEKYGPICRVDLLTLPTYVINDFQLAKDLFSKEEMSGRPSDLFSKYVKGYYGNPLGLISSEGQLWQTQRRFSLMKLKNLGFGKKTMESAIYEEVDYLFDIIEGEKTSTGDILAKDLFNVPIINVIWQIIGSTRYEHNNKQDRKYLEAVANLLKIDFNIKFVFPPLFWLLPYSQEDLTTMEFKKHIEKIIDEHDENLDINAPNDFMDNYLIEMRKGSDPSFTKEQLVVTCIDLFIAGSETTSTTLTWMLLFMVLHEDYQEKCFREISQVLGSVNPREEDMTSLPFCMATLNEIQRLGNIAPAGLLHVNSKAIKVEGYTIPKGSHFSANLRKFHIDPNVFEDPETFNPYRFYNTKVDPQFAPFGFGKRVCMGISMAKKELYYFFIMFIQNYKITTSKIHGPPDPSNIHFGTTACPNPFYVNLIKRSHVS